jgi:hypothetical protein
LRWLPSCLHKAYPDGLCFIIIAVNGGKIEEFGSHDELMARQGFYYNLYMSQFKGKLPGSAEVDMSQFVST